MLKSPLFKHSFVLFFIIGLLELVSMVFYLHWTLWWFDVVLHFLGGAWAAMTVIFVWHYHRVSINTSQLKIIWVGVIGAFFIGFMWEIYELSISATSFADGISYVRDTTSDLVMDCCGGFFASLYSFKILSKNV